MVGVLKTKLSANLLALLTGLVAHLLLVLPALLPVPLHLILPLLLARTGALILHNVLKKKRYVLVCVLTGYCGVMLLMTVLALLPIVHYLATKERGVRQQLHAFLFTLNALNLNLSCHYFAHHSTSMCMKLTTAQFVPIPKCGVTLHMWYF